MVKSVKRKHAPLILLVLGGAIGGLFLLLRKRLPGVYNALHGRYLLLAGLFGSMAGVLFLLFRAIRFLIRLYP